MMLVSLISYVDRNTLALLAPTILQETRLSNQQYGYIISAFSIAYMLGNPAWGVLLDRIGLRRGMTAAVGLWTLASAAHAWAGGLPGFALLRALLGFGEGATFPGGLRTVMQTLPVEKQSRGIAIAYSGGSLGAVVTPWIITPVAAWWGWRGAFWFTGLIGAAWLAGWWWLSRRPALRAVPTRTASVSQRTVSFRDPKIWSFMLVYALGGSPLAFILYNSSLYFGQALHRTQTEIGWVLWIPPLGWELGYFFWGWMTDRLPTGPGFYAALWRQNLLLTALSLPLAAIPHTGGFGTTLALMFFAMFIGAGFIIGAVAFATRLYSVANAGLIAGLGAGSWSSIVALLAPLFGRLFDQRRYDVAFLVAALLPLAGFALWSLINHDLARPRGSELTRA
jgi:ACS family hexuronate transporter-like MFS transporter